MAENHTFAGAVELTKLDLYSLSTKTKVSLLGMFVELDLFEDMFSPTMTGHITVFDTLNLISSLPIIGEEIVTIEFSTPDTRKISLNMYVYKLENRIIDEPHKQAYSLKLISTEAIADINTKLSRSFSGYTHAIAGQVFDNYINNYEYANKFKLDATVSSNEIKMVSPYWSPFKIMNYCASKSMGSKANRMPNFLFFQDNQQFRFTDTDTLLSAPAEKSYFYDADTLRNLAPQGGTVRDMDREYKTILDVRINTAFDYIKRTMGGFYHNTVLEHDIIRKTIKHRIFDYSKDFDTLSHLEKNAVVSKNFIIPTRTPSIETRTNFPFSFNSKIDDKSGEILAKRLPILNHLDLFSIDMTIHGRSDIRVGETIDFVMGTFQPQNKDKKVVRDKYYSGKYLITAIQHRISKSKHEIVCQMVKDSLFGNINE